ncbi:MAG: DUF3592 domain-containing protein [Proteobacteria bacterium]|nr:DUF3592 domain-containing protein [Pseudomonadota bacterium]
MRPAGRVAELGSLGHFPPAMEIVRYPLLTAGVGFILYGLWGFIRSLRCYRVCEGVIVGYEQHQEYSLFAPRIEFTGTDGIVHTFLSQLYGSQEIPIGGRVRIRYSPAQPDRAEVARFSALWLFPLVWLAFGIGFLLVSILTPRQDGLSGDF